MTRNLYVSVAYTIDYTMKMGFSTTFSTFCGFSPWWGLGEGDRPAKGWFSPSPAGPSARLPAAPGPTLFPLRVFRKEIFSVLFLGQIFYSRVPTAAVWWGLLKHGRALVAGPALAASGPEPGALQGTPGPVAPPCARWGGARCQGSPQEGAAILQHHLYTASALAVDVPPLRGAGTILCGGSSTPHR